MSVVSPQLDADYGVGDAPASTTVTARTSRASFGNFDVRWQKKISDETIACDIT